MSTSPDMAERHARQLARYAEIAMRAAEKVDGQLDAAEEPAALASLVGSLHKAGRVLRMSIALEAKLARDAERATHESMARDEARRERAVATRKAQVRNAVERQVWTEIPRSEAGVWTADLAERVDDEALYDTFLDEPVEAQVARVGRELGLTGDGERDYVPRAVRHHRRFLFDAVQKDDEDEDDDVEEDEDEDEADAAPEPQPEPPPSPPPRPPDPDWVAAGRLAPPMDLPSWECE